MALLGKRCKNSLIYYLVAGLMGLVRLLPLSWAPLGGRGLGKLAYLLGRRERRRALSNLARAFPDQSAGERRRMVHGVFMHLGQSALECVLMSKITKRLGTRESPVSFSAGSLECLLRAKASRRGIIFITAHFGNWELMAAEVARHARVEVLSKPSYDDRFTNMINRFREKHGVFSIDVTRSGHLLKARQILRRGHLLGVLLDQPVANGHPLPFLGHEAPTTLVAAALARWTGACILGGFIHRQTVAGHVIDVREINVENYNQRDILSDTALAKPRAQAADLAATQLFSGAIEEAIMEYPEQWVWSLDRWRSTESNLLSSHNANVVPSPGN